MLQKVCESSSVLPVYLDTLPHDAPWFYIDSNLSCDWCKIIGSVGDVQTVLTRVRYRMYAYNTWSIHSQQCKRHMDILGRYSLTLVATYNETSWEGLILHHTDPSYFLRILASMWRGNLPFKYALFFKYHWLLKHEREIIALFTKF